MWINTTVAHPQKKVPFNVAEINKFNVEHIQAVILTKRQDAYRLYETDVIESDIQYST